MAARPADDAPSTSQGVGQLWVVATPLGNLNDASARLVDTLKAADAILAEDTRRAGILMRHFGIQTSLVSLHAHNEHARTEAMVLRMQQGARMALISDAGTPAISDPGAFLVSRAHEAGVAVSPIAGPSALACALSVAGFVPGLTPIHFVGFLPRPPAQRRRASDACLDHPGITVIFESPERIASVLVAWAQKAPKRRCCVCRELTKIHEEVRCGQLDDLVAWAQSKTSRGEYTVVLGPDDERADTTCDEKGTQRVMATDDGALKNAVRRCMAAGLSARDAAHAVAAILEVSKNRAYRLSHKVD